MRLVIRLLTVLLGLVLLAAGALLLTEIVLLTMFPDVTTPLPDTSSLEDELSAVSWRSTVVRTGAAVTAVLGLVLLWFSLRAGRGEIRLHDPAEGVTVVTRPRSLARVVGHRVRAEQGVAKATVVARRGAVRVTAVGDGEESEDLEHRLRETARTAVDELPLVSAPKVSVTVRPAKRD
ncbi:DUF6286 domain-containing protein [Actinopolyspora mortivallis]|uniref:DUF6286 domain-containing protein n=1 Tax=Actinopolyspora mortivallis TaxID=33906 RepID=A0A2T0H156_ACTMO|nr:DUF6286 domain-containing protein [Actinopolyspora mortivallis]PRW65082.1 hypothetical protein CEP50_00655 [Actinopolyspora mortivallis]